MSSPKKSARAAEEARVYLIDASVYVFRAYYSLPDTLTNAAGQPVNGLWGFAGFLADLKRRVPAEAVIAVAFDESLSTSYRNEIYPEYKANRPPAPEDLKRQFAWCQDLCGALSLQWHADQKFEADDIIGTWSQHARDRGCPVAVITRDKDLTQLIADDDYWWDFAADRKLDAAGVEDKMGVPPLQVAELLALMGDSVDNIPGVRGVGPKAATALLQEFGSLDAVLANPDAVQELPLRGAKSLAQKLREQADMARLSLQLSLIPRDCAGVPSLEPRRRADAECLSRVCEGLGLSGQMRRRLDAYCR